MKLDPAITVDNHGDHMPMVARTARPAVVIAGNTSQVAGAVAMKLE